MNRQHIIFDGIDHVLTWSDWYNWTTFKAWQNHVPQTPGVYEAKFMYQMNRLTIGKADDLSRRIQYLRTGTHSAGERIRQNHPSELNNMAIRWAETGALDSLQAEKILKINHIEDYGALPTYTRQ